LEIITHGAENIINISTSEYIFFSFDVNERSLVINDNIDAIIARGEKKQKTTVLNSKYEGLNLDNCASMGRRRPQAYDCFLSILLSPHTIQKRHPTSISSSHRNVNASRIISVGSYFKVALRVGPPKRWIKRRSRSREFFSIGLSTFDRVVC